MQARRRALAQFVESTFLVGSLIAIIVCVLPAFGRSLVDWHDAALLCGFGLLVIIVHTAAAYVRPGERDETAERLEQAIYVLGEELKQHRESGKFAQLRRWATQDPSWAPTEPGPAIRMPSQQTRRTPGV